MNNIKKDPEELFKDIKKNLLLKPAKRVFRAIPEKYQRPIMTAVVIIAILGGTIWGIWGDDIKENLTKKLNKVLGTTNEASLENMQQDQERDSVAEKALEEDRVGNKCKGAQFDIRGDYFDAVGNERFFKEKVGVSARETEYYQASNKSKWACAMPFIVKVVAFPISGKSFGLFFEYEGVFKVLVGDGDRVTIKVEQNKWGPRGSWQVVRDEQGNERQKLGNPIEEGEEVLLTVKSKEENGQVHLRVEVHHSKFQSVEIFNYFFAPNAVNFQISQERKFRVGINDSRYKGEGSTVDLKTLSIQENEW